MLVPLYMFTAILSLYPSLNELLRPNVLDLFNTDMLYITVVFANCAFN